RDKLCPPPAPTQRRGHSERRKPARERDGEAVLRQPHVERQPHGYFRELPLPDAADDVAAALSLRPPHDFEAQGEGDRFARAVFQSHLPSPVRLLPNLG